MLAVIKVAAVVTYCRLPFLVVLCSTASHAAILSCMTKFWNLIANYLELSTDTVKYVVTPDPSEPLISNSADCNEQSRR